MSVPIKSPSSWSDFFRLFQVEYAWPVERWPDRWVPYPFVHPASSRRGCCHRGGAGEGGRCRRRNLPKHYLAHRVRGLVCSAGPVPFAARARGPDRTSTTVDPVRPELVFIVKADHDPIAFNCAAHQYRIGRRSAGACPCHWIPAAVAGPRVHTDLQIHVVAANSSEDISAADQTVGAGDGMARRADSGLDHGPVSGWCCIGVDPSCTIFIHAPRRCECHVMAPCHAMVAVMVRCEWIACWPVESERLIARTCDVAWFVRRA